MAFKQDIWAYNLILYIHMEKWVIKCHVFMAFRKNKKLG